MIGPHEPMRKVDLAKWEASWLRIRANQAKQRAEAETAEQKLQAWVKSEGAVVDDSAPRYEFPIED